MEMIVIKTKRLISMLLVGVVAIFLSMSLLTTVQAADTSSVKTTENDNCKLGVQKSTVTETQGVTEKKYKKAKTYTLTFNANGGKVTTKTKKLAYKKSFGTLPKPTRSGYEFQGWYTSKSGGKKVSKTTTMPAKNMVVYAQWKKANTDAKSKLVGRWQFEYFDSYPSSFVSSHLTVTTWYDFYFYADGRFKYFYAGLGDEKCEGKYSVSNGKVYFKEVKFYKPATRDEEVYNLKMTDPLKRKFGWEIGKWNDMTTEYKLGSDKEGNYLKIATPRNLNPPNSYTLRSAETFRKVS